MTYMIESINLSKTYVMSKGNEQTVLKNVDIQIKKGEFVTVMGASGSGKSTLLYNISGMDKMTSGNVVFNGQELAKLSEKKLSQLRLSKMGFIFQQVHLLRNLSIFDNIILSGYLSRKNDQQAINKRAMDLMSQMGIKELADHDITQASGGQLQRVGICRALINDPDIVFGDEPTGALNSKASGEILEILTSINQAGTTILLVSHDIKVAAKTERVLYMVDGCIIDEFHLGKYLESNRDLKDREERLFIWLKNLGF